MEEDREYEADLVVAWPGVGICVVEVKGGRVERDDAGRWFQTKAGQAPRPMSSVLQRVSGTWPKSPAYVGLFHDLPLLWGAGEGAEDDSDYYERRLPLALGELARQQRSQDLFDAVVVDEAQDFGELWWPALV